MQFHAEQTYRAPVEVVARAYTDPALYAALGESPRLGKPEVLSRREQNGIVYLEVRHRFTGHLSPAVAKVVDPTKLTWIEHTIHHLSRLEVEFRLAPDNYADRLRASGRCLHRAEGDISRRVVTGDVVVSGIPLLGKAVERAIVSGLQQHLAAEAPLVERFLESC